MNAAGALPPLDDVLNAFAVESESTRETLERYLRLYPSYAAQLVDLSRELNRCMPDVPAALSDEDEAAIAGAWSKHADAKPKAQPADPFALLSVEQLRQAAVTLDVPRQVIAAIRNGKVIMDSVPRKFLRDLAATINSTLENLVSAIPSARPVAALSFKADEKPATRPAVTFERLLIEASVPEDKRARLLSESD
jgi:hypothetical protein